MFDIGIATSRAIRRIDQGTKPEPCGGFDEEDNGNGSLMRILPLIIYTKEKTIEERYRITKQVSSITHGHIRSVITCFYCLEFARQLIEGKNKFDVYKNLQTDITNFLNVHSINQSEVNLFNRLLNEKIYEINEEKIYSSGYVLHTLEASIWCLMTTSSYKEAVLKAVNLGQDTDTTGAVTGGLVGILYSYEDIPKKWIKQIARSSDIENLADRLCKFACR